MNEMCLHSPAMDRIIERATRGNPGERYQRAEDLALDLRALRTRTDDPTLSLVAHRRDGARLSRRRAVLAMVAAGLALVLLTVLAVRRLTSARSQDPSPRVIAVLPFDNVGHDAANEAFCDGLVQTLAAALTELQQFEDKVVVVPASEV